MRLPGLWPLLLIVPTTAFSAELPCVSWLDRGMAVSVRGESPLGPGTSVTVYPDGVAVRVPPKHVVLFSRLFGDWYGTEGNLEKGEMDERSFDLKGSYFDTIEVKRHGDEITLKQ